MIIFVAGVHGVGKTYLAAPTAQKLGIKHASASQLIRDARKTQSWTENKRVDEVDDNQIALISALNKLKEKDESLLLDGHFVLRDENNIHIPIDPQVFKALGIDAVVLLEVDANNICARLIERGDYSWTHASLNSFVASESAHAVSVTSFLGLPLQRLKNPDHAEFTSVIKSFLEKA